MPKVPTYCCHKASRQAVVHLDGQDIYLGRFGTPESRERYNRIVAEWLANGRRLSTRSRSGPTVVELCASYLLHAKEHYRRGLTPEN